MYTQARKLYIRGTFFKGREGTLKMKLDRFDFTCGTFYEKYGLKKQKPLVHVTFACGGDWPECQLIL